MSPGFNEISSRRLLGAALVLAHARADPLRLVACRLQPLCQFRRGLSAAAAQARGPVVPRREALRPRTAFSRNPQALVKCQISAASLRPRHPIRPSSLTIRTGAVERPRGRPRQTARVHARVVDAPRRGHDCDRRHRLDGGVRRRSAVAVLAVETRRSGVQGRRRLRRPDDVLRHVDQHRAHHRRLGHRLARSRRRRPAARPQACGVVADHRCDSCRPRWRRRCSSFAIGC